MSEAHQRTERRRRKTQLKIWISYILFSSLIVWDVVVLISTFEPLMPEHMMAVPSTNSGMMLEMGNFTSVKEKIMGLMVQDLMGMQVDNATMDMMEEEMYLEWLALAKVLHSRETSSTVLEVVAIAGLLLVNLVALLGLKWRHPGFLVPWMIAYFVGLCTSFFRTAVMIIEEVYEKEPDFLIEPIFYSLGIGVVFSLVWIFVYTIFKELKAQPDERPAPVEV